MIQESGLIKRPLVSRNNRLVNSYIFGYDDRQKVSPDNRMVDADLGDLNSLTEDGGTKSSK